MFHYSGFFRFELEKETLRIVLFSDTDELKDLPVSQYSYYDGDLIVKDGGAYVEVSGGVYDIWKLWEPTAVSRLSDRKLTYVTPNSVFDRKVGFFTRATVLPYYKAGTKVVEDISSSRNVIIRVFNKTVTICGCGLTETL